VIKKLTAILLSLSTPSWASFTKAQTGCTNDALGVAQTTAVCTLTNNPAQNDLVVCAVIWWNGTNNGTPASMTVSDGSGNTFTKSPNSPVYANVSPVYLFYLANAPANANKTITATFTSTSGADGIVCDDFTVSGNPVSLDADNAGGGASGATVNTPTITVSGSGELLYAAANPGGALSTAGGSWTLGGNGIMLHIAGGSEYILSASANTALNFANSGGAWDSIGASFKQTAAATPAGNGSISTLPGTGSISTMPGTGSISTR
jgi:hypothetical protein